MRFCDRAPSANGSKVILKWCFLGERVLTSTVAVRCITADVCAVFGYRNGQKRNVRI